MHDDVFLIMNEGWVDAAKPRKTIEDKDRKLTETPDLVIGSGRSATKYKMDLIPPALIVARYFADEQAKVDELNAAAEEATRAVEEYIEEHAVEDGLLAEAMDDDKISKALATARLKEAKREGSDPDEIKALEHLIELYDAEAGPRRRSRKHRPRSTSPTLKKYGDLTEADVKSLVLDDKWRATDRQPHRRRGQLAHARLVAASSSSASATPRPSASSMPSWSKLEAKVAAHLADMGVKMTGCDRPIGMSSTLGDVARVVLEATIDSRGVAHTSVSTIP